MTVTVDELVFLVGKQAIELDRLRREVDRLARTVAERDATISELRAPKEQAEGGPEQ